MVRRSLLRILPALVGSLLVAACSAPEPELVATLPPGNWDAIAATSDAVFVVGRELRRIPLDGGPPATLAVEGSVDGRCSGDVGALKIAGDQLYWLDGSSHLHKVPLAGGADERVTVDCAEGLALGSDGAYFLQYGTDPVDGTNDLGLYHWAGGAAPALVTQVGRIWGFAMRDDIAYWWQEDGALIAADVHDPQPTKVFQRSQPVYPGFQMIAAERGLYWREDAGVMTLAPDQLDGGGAAVVVTTQRDYEGRLLIADDDVLVGRVRLSDGELLLPSGGAWETHITDDVLVGDDVVWLATDRRGQILYRYPLAGEPLPQPAGAPGSVLPPTL